MMMKGSHQPMNPHSVPQPQLCATRIDGHAHHAVRPARWALESGMGRLMMMNSRTLVDSEKGSPKEQQSVDAAKSRSETTRKQVWELAADAVRWLSRFSKKLRDWGNRHVEWLCVLNANFPQSLHYAIATQSPSCD
jgi:hypothetical protein